MAVLCPGPTLKQTWPVGKTDGGYNAVVAVNRAALFDHPDVWCFNDPRVFIDYHAEVGGRPQLLMPKLAEYKIDKAGLHDHLYRNNIVHVDDIEYPMRIVTGFTNYTYPTALAYCKMLGATRVDVYGNDRTSEPDYDGNMPKGCNRNPARWQAENEIVRQTAEWLGRCGITLERVTPEGRYGIA